MLGLPEVNSVNSAASWSALAVRRARVMRPSRQGRDIGLRVAGNCVKVSGQPFMSSDRIGRSHLFSIQC